MIPQVVVFDLGKVLVGFDYRIAHRRIAARSRVTMEEVRRFVEESSLLLRFETGAMTARDFYREAVAATGFVGSYNEFALAFGDIFVPIPVLIEAQASLRQRGVPTFIFSNTNELAIRHIRQQFAFYHNFDGYILSYEHGAMKPEAALYAVVERVTCRRGGELLYIDDRPENVDAGRTRGWQVILQDNPERTRDAIERAIFPC
jgi:FMN phosphatase YigB (HAD superfamily)